MPRSVDTQYNVLPNGSILFQKIDLTASTSFAIPEDNRVNWHRLSDGSVVGDIGVNDLLNPFNSTSMILEVKDPDDATRYASLGLLVENAGTIQPSKVNALAQGPDSGGTPVTEARLIIDSAGQSSFLQLLVTGERKVSFGSTGAIFVNGGSITNSINVAHGLGVVPTMVAVVPWAEDSGIWLPYYGSGGWDATNFQVAAIDSRGLGHGPGNLGGTLWMAIG